MKKNFLLLLSISALFISACSSGRSAYQKGDYYKAVIASVERLRQSPSNKRAKENLREAYPSYLRYNQDKINLYLRSAEELKFERVMDYYAEMNKVYDDIMRCPACERNVKAVSYKSQEEENRKNAADARMALGNRLKNNTDRQSLKTAYSHFQRALELRPDYTQARQAMDAVRESLTVHVRVEPIPMHSRMLSLSNEFFENQMQEYFRNAGISPFIKFHDAKSAPAQYNHIVEMQFDDFVVGQTFMKETVLDRTKDSVIIGKMPIKPDSSVNVYGTVRAKMHVMQKSINSGGVLNVRIKDARNGSILYERKFPGSYVWQNQWGYFNGDERALSNEDRNVLRGRDVPPPPPQQLFLEFTKPIYSQVTSFITNAYQGY